MLRQLLLATSALVASTAARAEISGVYLEPVYEGYLTEQPEAYVACYDLKVEITGADAWTLASGVEPDEPWVYLCGGVFFQHPMGSDGPPDPNLFEQYPDLRYDSFYTSHLCWPNTEDQGSLCGGFAGPAINEPTRLTAAWFWTPDGNFYPGTFTIARFTVIPDSPDWCTEVHVQVGSIETAPAYYYFGPLLGCYPADLDGDWDVDLADLAQLLACYYYGPPPWECDVDGDWDVDLADLAALLGVYGTTCY
jgi:hypothetical protein